MAKKKQKPNNLMLLIGYLRRDFWKPTLAMIIFQVLLDLVTLAVPGTVGKIIDQFENGDSYDQLITLLIIIIIGVLIFDVIKGFYSMWLSEMVARYFRRTLSNKISRSSFSYINKVSTSKLLTNFTSDTDELRNLLSFGVSSIISAGVVIFGSAILLITINWKLGLAVLLVFPISFFFVGRVFSKIGDTFKRVQEVTDTLNKVINESIVGAALVRVLSSQKSELSRFEKPNTNAKIVGVELLTLFGSVIPAIGLIGNIAIVVVVMYGGLEVINDNLTIGEFTAFYSYIGLLIGPLFFLGFISSFIVRALTSFGRINEVLSTKPEKRKDELELQIKGNIEFKNVSLRIGDKQILDKISFKITGGKRIGLLGPTAAGKTMLFYLMTGLMKPTSGEILIDGEKVESISEDSLRENIGMVFQDNIIFNASIKENVTLNKEVSKKILNKALDTSDLKDYVTSLKDGLTTEIGERGTNLSGGQKQRVGLARALAIDPQVILLDDFTSRVDISTEKSILGKLQENYPGTTQIFITQKISTIKDFDKIILLMEGELIADGTHEELMDKSLDYEQIFASQQSTEE